jgi:phosphatidylglycerol:prolipoprotein diacylglycerol transferase
MRQVIFPIPIYTSWTPNGIPIYGFGVMLFIAFILCTWMAGKRGEKEGITKETIQDLAIWIFIGGLLGARLTFLLSETHVQSLTQLLLDLPRIWDGGIVLYGSVLGGLAGYFLAYVLVFRRKGLSTLRLADVIAPAFAVGLCLGRLGCFLNGCCYGGVACASCAAVTPVSFPMSAPPREDLQLKGWQTAAGFTLKRHSAPGGQGVQVEQVDPASAAYRVGLRPGDVITHVNGQSLEPATDSSSFPRTPAEVFAEIISLQHWPRGQSTLTVTVRKADQTEGPTETTLSWAPWTLGLYPTQLYEVISMFLLFLVLTAYYPLRRQPGQVMAILMMGYAVHRYLNEILRNDPRPEGFEKYGSVILFAAGLLLWLTLALRPIPPAAPESAPTAPGSGREPTPTPAS